MLNSKMFKMLSKTHFHKGTAVAVNSSDLLINKGNDRFTTVPLKKLLDKWQRRYRRFF